MRFGARPVLVVSALLLAVEPDGGPRRRELVAALEEHLRAVPAGLEARLAGLPMLDHALDQAASSVLVELVPLLAFVSFLLLVISLVNAIFLKLSARALSSLYSLDSLGLPADQTLLRTVTQDGVVMGRIGGIATTSVIIMTLAAPLLGVMIRRNLAPGIVVFLVASAVCLVGVVAGFYAPVAISPVSMT